MNEGTSLAFSFGVSCLSFEFSRLYIYHGPYSDLCRLVYSGNVVSTWFGGDYSTDESPESNDLFKSSSNRLCS